MSKKIFKFFMVRVLTGSKKTFKFFLGGVLTGSKKIITVRVFWWPKKNFQFFSPIEILKIFLEQVSTLTIKKFKNILGSRQYANHKKF